MSFELLKPTKIRKKITKREKKGRSKKYKFPSSTYDYEVPVYCVGARAGTLLTHPTAA